MRIEAYDFGRITVAGKTYQNDVIILPDRVIDNWWRKSGHLLQVPDIEVILEDPPEVLVVGQGMPGKMVVDEELRRFLADRRIAVLALPTNQAVASYNELAPKQKVAAALHLTC